jgi:hypothetical protein
VPLDEGRIDPRLSISAGWHPPMLPKSPSSLQLHG